METMLLQLFTAFLGSFGFSLVFHVRPRWLPLAGLGGLLGWGIYLLCSVWWEGVFLPSFVGSAFAALYGEVLARVLKAPAPTFFIPAVIPLIPGSSLYYMMSYAVRREWAIAQIYSSQTLQAALAIAAGISLVWALWVMETKILQRIWRRA